MRRPLMSITTAVIIIGLWQSYVTIGHVPATVVPGPLRVLHEVLYLWTGELPNDVRVTVVEILVGMGYGIAVGGILGVLLGKSRTVQRLLMPAILIIQTAPKISLAPLLILWFGLGLTSKAILVAIAVFYPVMINLSTAIRTVEPNARTLFRLLEASPMTTFLQLELPYAWPAVLAGIRVGTTQAVTAVVIGELIGAEAGLGYLLSSGENNADITMVLTSVVMLSVLGFLLYIIVRQAERWLVRWTEAPPSLL